MKNTPQSFEASPMVDGGDTLVGSQPQADIAATEGRIACDYEGCKSEATHELTLTITDSERPDTVHHYCPWHAEVAEIDILRAAATVNRLAQVRTSKRPMWTPL